MIVPNSKAGFLRGASFRKAVRAHALVLAAVSRYNDKLQWGFDPAEQRDLSEYLKSL